jgi:GT2 family glycosyltransferase
MTPPPTHLEERAVRMAVVVPTLRRPDDLRRCLNALRRQSRPAAQVVVVRRQDDAGTATLLADTTGLPLDVVVVDKPGVMHALQCGLAAVRAEIVAITDDDAVPHDDWLERIFAAFQASDAIVGVGGRDVIAGQDIADLGGRGMVGRVRWWGKVVGNHHLGIGAVRDVDVLKGVNCAYRVEPLRQVGFEQRMKGSGAQVHFELAIGLGLVRRGWRLVYDPAILVGHFPAARHDADQRGMLHAQSLSNEVHNETFALLRHFPPARRVAFLAWALACGTRTYPGALCWLAGAVGGRPRMIERLLATLQGRWQGLSSWREEQSASLPVAALCGRPDLSRPPLGDAIRPAMHGMTATQSE